MAVKLNEQGEELNKATVQVTAARLINRQQSKEKTWKIQNWNNDVNYICDDFHARLNFNN